MEHTNSQHATPADTAHHRHTTFALVRVVPSEIGPSNTIVAVSKSEPILALIRDWELSRLDTHEAVLGDAFAIVEVPEV